MTFKKTDLQSAFIYQGVSPDRDVEADHIFPKSKGGLDTVENLQLIDRTSNRKKSAHVINLRKWQKEFLNDWESSTESSFLCVSVPGGGKTIAALSAANKFLRAGSDRRVLIVVPTANLRRQWAVDAQKFFGINLQSKEFGTNFKDGFVGGVTTYQTLDNSAGLFRLICANSPTLVILDEPHHCGENKSWGDNALYSFELAARRLLISGTPFRTDGQPIPFVRYEGNQCVADHQYDYKNALIDNVIRTVMFDYSKCTFEEIYCDQHRTVEFHGEITDQEASEHLRQILNASGDFVAQMIRDAHAKLMSIRQNIKDAGAMAVCMDILHAQAVAKVIRSETGCEPSIVVSQEESATDTVDNFRRNKNEWLISVRQVSEGTDIKRLQVLCYLTNATTELIFRQLIGRISRVRFQESEKSSLDATEADLEGYVFLPADPRLIDHARRIEEMQLNALKEIVDPQRQTRELKPNEMISRFFIGSTHDGTDRVVILGKEYSNSDMDYIHRLVSYGINMEKAARIYEGELKVRNVQHNSTPQEIIETEEDKISKLRRNCQNAANRYAKMIGTEVKNVHCMWPPHSKMGVKQLQEKFDRLMTLIKEHGK